MSAEHAVTPSICPDCLAVMHSRVPVEVRARNLIYPCRHQPGGVTVAIAFVVGGVIKQWHMSGPMGEEEASVMALQFLEANSAVGGHVQEFNARRSGNHN